MANLGRRALLGGAAAAGAAMLLPRRAQAAGDLQPIFAEIEKRRAESLQRLQTWMKQQSIAAENRGVKEGCELAMGLLREAGFQHVEKVPTDGQPGIFATLDAGAAKTVGLYFMYDVKQADHQTWSSPPWEARIVDLPKLGKAVMGRGAVNQKGPQASFLAALHAIRGAGRKLPVNLVLVAEGEEEIGSPHFLQIVKHPAAAQALSKCLGVFMPTAAQGLDGRVSIVLGAKGVIEIEITSSGEKWGRGPKKDIHSGNRARVDSPAWHLVQALNTLVDQQGNPAIDGFGDDARPLSKHELEMIDQRVAEGGEEIEKTSAGVSRWARDADWRQSLIDLCGKPTVNIEGLVGGWTGQGGMTVLPASAKAKLDLRLVPDMTAAAALSKLNAHLSKRGFGDLEVKLGGGYDPTTTPWDSAFIRASQTAYKQAGVEAHLWPRGAGSWPGYVFTGEPLKLPAGHFGMGHGMRAHAPDEYYLIESADSKLQGMDGAIRSFAIYLHELAG